MIDSLLIDVAVLVALPFLLWRIAGRAVPLAVLPILIGLALSVAGSRLGLGPLLTPSAAGGLIGWAGVLILAYCAGLEAKPQPARCETERIAFTARRVLPGRILATALAALALPFLAGTAAAYWGLLGLDGWAPAGVDPRVAAAGIGLCLAVSALPVLVGIVRELPQGDRNLGRLALRIAVIDDAVLWIGLGGLLLLARADSGMGGWGPMDLAAVAALGALHLIGRRVDRMELRVPPVLALAGAAGFLAAGAWATSVLGVHALLGAYLAGALTPVAVSRHLPAERLGFLALAGLAPLFFGYRGLGIDGGVFGWEALAASVALLLLSASTKVLAVLLVPPSRDLSRRETLGLGCLLQCKGLMEIVAATILRDQGVLTEPAYAVLVTLAILSTAVTLPLFRLIGAARSGAEAEAREGA